MPRKPSLTSVVSKGEYRASLAALRDRLAGEIETGMVCRECGGPITSQTAPLAKQLADVLKALSAIPTGREETLDDELARRRPSRRAASGSQVGAAGERSDEGRGRRSSG